MSIGWPSASSLSARLYLRIGFRDTALLGTLLCLTSGLIFTTLPRHASVGEAAVGAFVMGAGLGLLSTPVIVGIQSVVHWNRRGVVTSANMFGRQLGQAVGAAIFGALANSALIGWFDHAPASFSGVLPHSINAANNVLGKGSHLPAAAEAYVRLGLFHATHRVFLALAIIAAAGIVVLLATPRTFTPPYDDQAEADEPAATAEPGGSQEAAPTTDSGSAIAR
jgi:MFS family permease